MGKVDLSGGIQALFEESLRKAKKHTEKGDRVKASTEYGRCSKLMKQLAEYSFTEKTKNDRLRRAKEYAELSEKLRRQRIAKKKKVKGVTPPDAEEDFQDLTLSMLEKVAVTWDDIGGLEAVKNTLIKSIVLTYAQAPENVKIKGWERILLFGPPGTGKTLLAAATSNELNANFFNVRLSTIESKWFGESPKILHSVFEVARKKEPAVIFFDEVDSVAGSRSKMESEGRRALLSTFLSELDGLLQKGRKEFVLTLIATNTPWELDHAVTSRCQKRVYIPLPDKGAREEIFYIHLNKNGFKTNVDKHWLGEKTHGYSGRDIETLCLDAVNNMVEEMNPEAIKLRALSEIRNYEIKIRSLTERDFEKSFKKIKPATTSELLKAYENWNEQFGAT